MNRTPMKRGGFKRQMRHEREDVDLKTTLRPLTRGTYSGGTKGAAIPKEEPLQHAGYMNAVRDLGYCMRCKRTCRPQFCHRDEGKGMGMKTDCREGWPGCPECHYAVGTSGQYPKEERRALELELGRLTREAVIAAGTYPARLAKWSEA